MAINQNWGDVWPAARPFHPATVPLPIHMSYIDDNKQEPPIGKFNNPELLKIPNFLHLTPPVVKRQCQALKKFCTKWPEALKSDQDCDRHFPITVVTKDLIFSGPSIRWPDSRVVEIILKLSDLNLDEHSADKLKRLLRHRYNHETDEISLRTDSCPLKKQNYDYGQYLLTALYFESWVFTFLFVYFYVYLLLFFYFFCRKLNHGRKEKNIQIGKSISGTKVSRATR